VHEFHRQLSRGTSGESVLDAFFRARGHYIQAATRGQQQNGIDRVFLKDGKIAYVEYKTDYRAHETKRIFIETVSVDVDNTEGWVYTCAADYLIYYVPALKTIYVMPLEVLREALPEWATSYPTRSAQNQGYATHGVLVPLDVFAAEATQVFTVEPGKADSGVN
jgi:hypothetical protein